MELLLAIVALTFIGYVAVDRRRDQTAAKAAEDAVSAAEQSARNAGERASLAQTKRLDAERNAAAAAIAQRDAEAKARDAEALARQALNGEYQSAQRRVDEANQARDAAQKAQANAARAADAARAASAEHERALADAARVIADLQPQLTSALAEKAPIAARLATWPGIINSLGYQRRQTADRIVRFAEVLRVEFVDGTGITTRPYSGPIDAVDDGSPAGGNVLQRRLQARSFGWPEPYPNTRVVSYDEAAIRARFMELTTQLGDSLRRQAADVARNAELDAITMRLQAQIAPARAVVDGRPPPTMFPILFGGGSTPRSSGV